MAYRARKSSSGRARGSARRSYAGRRPPKRRSYSARRGGRRSAHQVVRLVVESAPSTALQRPYSGEVQALMPVGMKRAFV